MRHNLLRDGMSCTDVITYPDGRVVTNAYDSVEVMSDIYRSDVVKSPANQSGWREPTPYGVSSYKLDVPLTGAVSVDQTYTRWDPPQKVFQLVSGYLPNSNVARINVLRHSTIADVPLVSANVENRLIVNARLKVRDQKVNLALAFAEANKTAAGIGDRLLMLYRSARALKKGQINKAWKEIGLHPGNKGKKAASTWLEVQYGWLPLMSDIKGSYEQLTRKTRDAGLKFKVKTTYAEQSDSSVNYNGNDGLSPFIIHQVDKLDQRAQLVMYYVVDNPELLTASAVGLTDPFSIVWELTPYSFLFDWVVPIGDFLGSISATEGTSFVSGTYTRTSRLTRRHTAVGITISTGYGTLEGKGTAVGLETRFEMSRKVIPSSPMPLPFIKNPLSVGHALNALALLRGVFK